MSERVLQGLAASPGAAVGSVRLLEALDGAADVPHRGPEAESAAALAALDAEAAELAAQAERLREAGLVAESDILIANGLMARDPLLRSEVTGLTETLTAAAALRAAANRHGDLLAALPDAMLAARATDVRELGRRAARRLAPAAGPSTVNGPSVLLARDLGPADVADLREQDNTVVAIALAAGAATSHAAIMARSLGLPMVVAAGDELLRAEDTIVVDADAGVAYLEPSQDRIDWARGQMERLAHEQRGFARARALPPVTLDGQWVTLLGNAATAAEIRAGIDAESDGVGLLRTELAFLEASAWPTEAEHVRMLEPLLALLGGRIATVRVLDFGSDKTPPFLEGTAERGLALLLGRPDALASQLRGILRAAGEAELRILLPLVESPQQVRAVRSLLREAAADTGRTELPPLGAMIETPAAARLAHEIALEADFLSIGTNDLVQYTLGYVRTEPLATALSAADPRVLGHVAATVAAAHAAGVTVEVCGESASVPQLAALYVGLGVDELSAAPARLDELRATVRGLSAEHAARAVERALTAGSEQDVLAIADALLSGELGDQQGEALGGRDGVFA